MSLLAGIDIGGTKCAVSLGKMHQGGIEILVQRRFFTADLPDTTLQGLSQTLEELLVRYDGSEKLQAIGISCGGPLDSEKGLILSPPNLPGWDQIAVTSYFSQRFHVPVGLQNDANACALAEWKWGAGQGLRNLIFLTFGTGMGAGLILNGKLYSGTNDMAGEVGHIRLEADGPTGFGKAGSFEGFCSGGGIARLAGMMVRDAMDQGITPSFCKNLKDPTAITAEMVGEAAKKGDSFAIDIFKIVGKQLGKGLAILIDVLNPECIIIGSIYGRQRTILEPVMMEILRQEALPQSLSMCRIIPAGLGEKIGDYASLSIASYQLAKTLNMT